jgi:hypothetical protein
MHLCPITGSRSMTGSLTGSLTGSFDCSFESPHAPLDSRASVRFKVTNQVTPQCTEVHRIPVTTFSTASRARLAARQPWPGHGQDQAVRHAMSPHRLRECGEGCRRPGARARCPETGTPGSASGLGNGPGAIPAPRPRPTQPRQDPGTYQADGPDPTSLRSGVGPCADAMEP